MRNRLFVLLLLSIPIVAQAQGTQLWKQSSFESFEKGTPHGVAIRSDGQLRPFTAPVEVVTTASSAIWSATTDGQGNVYLGTGSPATVLKISPSGKQTTLLATKDLSVQVVKLGPDGMLYAATLPNGKVYRLNPNGGEVNIDNAPQPVYKQQPGATTQPEGAPVVFDPETLSPKPAYLWDLAFDAAGRLYVATGGPADIYRVDLKRPGATPEKFFSSSEQHIRRLLFAKDGALYAGTDGRGLIYRISPDGKGFVLFESPRQEISAMAFDPQGNLYLATLGDKTRTSLPPLTVHSEPTVTATIRIVTSGPSAAASDSTLVPNGSLIYELTPDGTPRQLWASPHDVVYALAWQPGNPGGLLVGSGNQGHVYRVDADGTYEDLAHLEAVQTTAFASTPDALYAATSNLGKLYRLPDDENKSGESTYTSTVHDAHFFSQWGRAEVRGTGKFDLFARTGNIEQPTEGWSDWKKVTPGTREAVLEKARFLQWKAVLSPGARLNEVGFYYLPQNVAPVVDSIVIQLHVRASAALNPGTQTNPVAINLPQNTTDGVSYQVDTSTPALMAARARNWATVRWAAHDDNGDQLSYSVYTRGDNESNWLLLQKNLNRTYATFDLTRIPDGGYTLRVVASDAPSHPAAGALTGYMDSGHFLLDTTPPMLSPLQASMANGSIHATFDAQTRLSTVERADYSVDAGPWQYMEPVGRLSDAPQEHYDLTIPVPAAGSGAEVPAAVAPASSQHVLAVRVVDRAGNVATEKTVVQ